MSCTSFARAARSGYTRGALSGAVGARGPLSAAVAAALILLAGCGPSQPTRGGGQSSGLAPADAVTAAAAPVDSLSPSTAPTQFDAPEAPQPAASYPTTARAYAEATVAAWSTHDLTGLADLTTAEVHEQFLEIPGQLKTDWIYHSCDGVAGSSYCTLRNGDGDEVRLKITHQYLGGPHAAVELKADLTEYPVNGEQYVTEFVTAWAARNTPRMRALARPNVVVAVNDNHQDRPQGSWVLSTVGQHGGAGLLMVQVDVGEGDVHFRLDVGTTLLGTPRAIVGYGFP